MFFNDLSYADTNSNFESLNGTFKGEYTKYYKSTVLATCRKIFNCIRDYSDSSQKRNYFNKIPRFDKEIKEKANKIERNQFKKSHTRSTRIEYTGL
jgi:hypothetical protein